MDGNSSDERIRDSSSASEHDPFSTDGSEDEYQPDVHCSEYNETDDDDDYDDDECDDQVGGDGIVKGNEEEGLQLNEEEGNSNENEEGDVNEAEEMEVIEEEEGENPNENKKGAGKETQEKKKKKKTDSKSKDVTKEEVKEWIKSGILELRSPPKTKRLHAKAWKEKIMKYLYWADTEDEFEGFYACSKCDFVFQGALCNGTKGMRDHCERHLNLSNYQMSKKDLAQTLARAIIFGKTFDIAQEKIEEMMPNPEQWYLFNYL